jgi:hypothetical protein
MVDSGEYQGITGVEKVRAIIQQHLDAACHDSVEIEGVRVMNRVLDAHRHLQYKKICVTGLDSGLVVAGLPRRTYRRRSFSQCEHVGTERRSLRMNVAISDRNLGEDAGTAAFVNASDKAAHTDISCHITLMRANTR